jgi:hypothetical protein
MDMRVAINAKYRDNWTPMYLKWCVHVVIIVARRCAKHPAASSEIATQTIKVVP